MKAIYLGKNEIKAIRELRSLVANGSKADLILWKKRCSDSGLSRQRIAEIIPSLQRKGFVSIDDEFFVYLIPLEEISRRG